MQISILALAALAFAFMGLVALAAPERVTGQFGMPSLTVDGRSEVRAVYGGFGLAVAAALGLALFTPTLRLPVSAAVAVALGGMAAGRLLSAIMDRRLGRIPMLYGAIEAAGSLMLLTAVMI